MKSEHRHQLETNWLATRVNRFVQDVRPHAATIAGIAIAIVAVMLIWTYWAGSSSARQSGAWDVYNIALGQRPPNVDALRLAAEENPGTAMQQMADVTWADSQVWLAARDYIYNRRAAMEALDRATSRYQGVIQSTDDERLLNRARLGMARIHEIRGELDKAREEYLKVKGAYEEYAKLQSERLEQPDARETYQWLASAQPPRPRTPMGPGTPGRRPDFSADDLGLPDASGSGSSTSSFPEGAPPQGEDFDKLLEGLNLDFGDTPTGDRYPAGEAPAGQQSMDGLGTPSGQEAIPAQGTSPATDAPAAEQPAETPADSGDNSPQQ
jgi:hypothetical protein